MFDYTPEGVNNYQSNVAISKLYSIDKKLKKINRNLSILTLLGLSITLFINKDKIKELKNLKGENRM